MRDLTFTVLPRKQCASCLFYPNDCGYWSNMDRHDVKKDKVHNCLEYSLDYSRLVLKVDYELGE